MSKRRRSKKTWSYTAGDRPSTVTVYERRPGGPLYVRMWDPTARDGQGNWVRRSLEHSDQEKAKTYALEQAIKLKRGQQELVGERTTLKQIFAAYEKHRTPRKSAAEQKADARRKELWLAVLGGDMDPHRISLHQWEQMIEARRTGSINARGNPVAESKRRTIRARAVQEDCLWLRLVFNWAEKWRSEATGTYLMRENPVRGFDLPREENPLRPVASEARYEAIRAVSDSVLMGKGSTGRSYLSEMLDIVHGTGRRLSAVYRGRIKRCVKREATYLSAEI